MTKTRVHRTTECSNNAAGKIDCLLVVKKTHEIADSRTTNIYRFLQIAKQASFFFTLPFRFLSIVAHVNLKNKIIALVHPTELELQVIGGSNFTNLQHHWETK